MQTVRKKRLEFPLTESQQKQKELEPIEDEIGTCITASMQRDKVATDLQVMKRRAQEAEGELSILKGIETNRVKEAQARSNQLQEELDRVKRENNDSFNRIAESLQVNESHQKLNGKLQVRITELEDENKKMHKHLDEQAEGELTILKGIETNRVKEAQDALANSLEVNESHRKLNGKLKERLTELEEELKRLNDVHDKKLDSARKAGL